MRILFTTFAASSHFNLQVPLAWALRAAGHEVCVASQPDLAETIKDAGLTAVRAGKRLDMAGHSQRLGRQGRLPGDGAVFDIAESRPEKLTWNYARGTLTLYATAMSGVLADDAMLDDLVTFARAWQPDLVVWDALTYVGPVAAQVCGAAHARMLFGPDHFGRMRGVFHELAAGRQDDPVRQWLSGRLARYGAQFSEDVVLGQVTIDPLPPWTRLPTGLEYLPVRFVPYAGRTDFPDWILRPPARPRVCLTLGVASRAFGLPTPSIRDLLAAVSGLDVEVIATLDSGQRATVGDVPDNVRVFEFVPLDLLLPTCSAIVHHFGAGTSSTATLHAVPQIRVSDSLNLWGEHTMAGQLVDRGAALDIGIDQLTPQVLRSKLDRILRDPSFAENAAQLRKEMLAIPAPHDVVSTLETLAARRGPL